MSDKPSHAYVHECGDGGYVSAVLSAPEGTVYPETFTLGQCLICDADPTVLRAVSRGYLAALDAEDDDIP